MADKQILVYITDNKERILASDALTLYITDEDERQSCIASLGKALRADVIRLKNGDYVLIS